MDWLLSFALWAVMAIAVIAALSPWVYLAYLIWERHH